ncbi:MAG TPA: protealysin inhibitor emfourin [Roseiflexaceae bacterium]|nr:protealysin inhibitor emfourin [Roseiflexaceae bacterium]
MRVELLTEGGFAVFPGLNKPIIVDSADLPPAEARRLKQLVSDARFFDLPAGPRALPKGAADMRKHTVTVEDAGRSHTVRLTEPIEDANLQALIEFLEDQRVAQRRASNPAADR